MAWCRIGDKPLYKLMFTDTLTHMCGTKVRWINGLVSLWSKPLPEPMYINFRDALGCRQGQMTLKRPCIYFRICNGSRSELNCIPLGLRTGQFYPYFFKNVQRSDNIVKKTQRRTKTVCIFYGIYSKAATSCNYLLEHSPFPWQRTFIGSMTFRIWGRLYKRFMSWYVKSCENHLCPNGSSGDPIGSQSCACHDSCVAMTCAKLRSDHDNVIKWKLFPRLC